MTNPRIDRQHGTGDCTRAQRSLALKLALENCQTMLKAHNPTGARYWFEIAGWIVELEQREAPRRAVAS